MKGISEKSLNSLQKKFAEQVAENKRLKKSLADATTVSKKAKETNEKQKNLIEGLKRENARLNSDISDASKKLVSSEKENKGREVRLARALEECDKFKEVLKSATAETKATGGDFRKEKDRLLRQVKSLERQRGEVLTAFKKQMKLVDVLKKQKVHAEAAKLLEFTEEEFVKVLDWGE